MTAPHAFHLLNPDDREWALDNSRRAYRVRRSQAGDMPARPWRPSPHLITIVCLHDAFSIVLTETCLGARMPFTDSDDYALHRLAIINRARRARGEVEV
ncbi:hypothetical protein [Methylobacterium sp. SI9]|uniref:hypothetical protein n=1 Tax=Methylobacterium guangdongense TaxID=3138811 RepID=UPI00313A772B